MSQQDRFTSYSIRGVGAALLVILIIAALGFRTAGAANDHSGNYFLGVDVQDGVPRILSEECATGDSRTQRRDWTIDTLSHQGLNSRQNCTPAPGDLTPNICDESGALDPVDFQARARRLRQAKCSPTRRRLLQSRLRDRDEKRRRARPDRPGLRRAAPRPATRSKCACSRWSRGCHGATTRRAPVRRAAQLPDRLDRKVIRITATYALFNNDIHIPLKPFQGIMAVAPADDYVSPIASEAALGYRRLATAGADGRQHGPE